MLIVKLSLSYRLLHTDSGPESVPTPIHLRRICQAKSRQKVLQSSCKYYYLRGGVWSCSHTASLVDVDRAC
jgi:hypothetical protein